MLKCLSFLPAEYRDGRPELVPLRKEDEYIIANNGEWNYQDYLRGEVDHGYDDNDDGNDNDDDNNNINAITYE